MPLTREQILGTQDTKIEDVQVPEWGGVVRMRGMTGAERDAFESASLLPTRGKGKNATRDVNLRNIRARLVASCAIDDNGALLFSAEDVERLGEKSGAVLDRLADVAKRLSGLSEADVDDIAKNSGSGQSDDSGSS